MPISNTSPNVQIWVTGAGGGKAPVSVNGDPGDGAGMTGYELTQFYQSTTDNPGTPAVAEGLYRPARHRVRHGARQILLRRQRRRRQQPDPAGQYRRSGRRQSRPAASPCSTATPAPAPPLGSAISKSIPITASVYFDPRHNLRQDRSTTRRCRRRPILADLGVGIGNPTASPTTVQRRFRHRFRLRLGLPLQHDAFSGASDFVTENYVYQLTGLTPRGHHASASPRPDAPPAVQPRRRRFAIPTLPGATGDAFPPNCGVLDGIDRSRHQHPLFLHRDRYCSTMT